MTLQVLAGQTADHRQRQEGAAYRSAHAVLAET